MTACPTTTRPAQLSASLTPGPLADMVRTTPTALWNDSADLAELSESIGFGAVGATCNPVIAYSTINAWPDVWSPRIAEIAAQHPTASEAEIGWIAVRRMSVEAAALLLPAFEAYAGRNGRLSVQTDPRLHRDGAALVAQAVEFSQLAPNIIVKIPATEVGIAAMEEATYWGVSINATVSFSVPQRRHPSFVGSFCVRTPSSVAASRHAPAAPAASPSASATVAAAIRASASA